jgi:predicted DNA-binding transcriptional regulator AlpA
MAANPSLLDDNDLLNPANWLGAKELAAILGVCQQDIYNTIYANGNLPPIYRRKGSTRIRFFKPEVRVWLQDPANFTRTVSGATEKACA